MSTVSTYRCSKQNHSHIQLGGNKPRPSNKRVATDTDIIVINKAILALSQAKQEKSEESFQVKLTDAYRDIRNVIRSWNDL